MMAYEWRQYVIYVCALIHFFTIVVVALISQAAEIGVKCEARNKLQGITKFLKDSHFITGVHPFRGTKVVTPSSRRTSSANLPVTTLCSNCGPRT